MDTTVPAAVAAPETANREPYSVRALLLYFLRLGALGLRLVVLGAPARCEAQAT